MEFELLFNLFLLVLTFGIEFVLVRWQQIQPQAHEIAQTIEKLIYKIKNPRPGIFHFKSQRMHNQPELAEYFDGVLLNKHTINSDPNMFEMVSIETFSIVEVVMKKLPNTAMNSEVFQSAMQSMLSSDICGIYGVDVQEIESDLESEKFNDLAHTKYKGCFKDLKSSDDLLELIQSINYLILTGNIGKSDFNKGGREVIVKPGANQIWNRNICEPFIRNNNPEYLNDYKYLLSKIENVINLIPKSLLSPDNRKTLATLQSNGCSMQDKFQLFIQFFECLMPDVIKNSKSKTLENFLEQYLTVCQNDGDKSLKRDVKQLYKMLQNPQANGYEIAAYAHQIIVDAHAFRDGNGRTARLAMNIILEERSVESIVFYSNTDYTAQVKTALKAKDHKLFAKYLEFLSLQRPAALTFYNDMQVLLNSGAGFRQVRADFEKNSQEKLPKYRNVN